MSPTGVSFQQIEGPTQTVGLEDLMPVVYDELRHLAAAQLAGDRAGQHVTLQPTSLVHEVYLRMSRRGLQFDSRRHFFFVSTRAMRDILLERARTKARRARRSDADPPDVEMPDLTGRNIDLLALDEALTRLEKHDATAAELVMLRFFGGLGVTETAEVLGRSPRTIKREWSFTKAWLRRELEG